MLDEADEMLLGEFEEQIHEIFKRLPRDVQVILLSAVNPIDLLKISYNLLRKPMFVSVMKDDKLNLDGKYVAWSSASNAEIRCCAIYLKNCEGGKTCYLQVSNRCTLMLRQRKEN